jgi:3-dehydroquinate synthetase
MLFGQSFDCLNFYEMILLSHTDTLIDIIMSLFCPGLWQNNCVCRLNAGLMSHIMRRDKKVREGRIRFTLPKRLGEMDDFGGEYACLVEEDDVINALAKVKRDETGSDR